MTPGQARLQVHNKDPAMALDIVAWGAITFGLTVAVQLPFYLIAQFTKTDKVN
jgi:hypothetical protein